MRLTLARPRCALGPRRHGRPLRRPGTLPARASALASPPPPPAMESTPLPSELEARQELELQAGTGDIYGIPRQEWLRLDKPARYLGNEFGACHKPWADADIRFALTYPEIYEVGASNLGHIILYGLLNQQPGLLCDRSYYPGADLKALLQRRGLELFGVEHRRPLRQFDVLGFSLSYELGGTNILDMLAMSGIACTWEARREPAGRPWNPDTGSPPLVFAGGPTATSNPEPFADFFDFFALGDGEELLVEIGDCLRGCRAEGLDRESTLLKLATSVEGVYVPQFYDAPEGLGGAVYPNRDGVPPRVRRRVCAPDPFQQIGLVPFVETVHDRLTVEIRRGCTRGCRFCQPGMLTRPARDVEPQRVVEAVEWGMRKTGYNEFSLLSLSCSDYLSLPAVGVEIKNRLKEHNVSLSLPSQRVDRFDDNIAHIISNAGKRSGLTFAPEAGTQRLRDIINKGLTNEELLRGVKTAWDQGWKQVKLYFMVGLPGETDADVLGIAETVAWLQRECRQGKWHLAVNLTISNFSPKPHTPFQWHSVSTDEFRRKQRLLKEALSGLHQVKANFTPVEISAMEDFVARGDRRIGAVMRRASELGATNDGWWQSTGTAHAAWSRAIEDCGLDWKYRQVDAGEWDVLEATGDARFRGQGGGGRGRLDRGALADDRLDRPLPWDHVDTGISKFWLKTDLQRALEAATVPDCSHSGLCSECGVCGDEFGDNVVFEPPPVPAFEGVYRPDSTRAQRLQFRFSKTGDAVFVGHLDMMSTWDRACRRAALPVTADESPFAVRQRIYVALPLPLGATGGAELLEIYLTRRMDPGRVLAQLQAQLPPGLQLHGVEEAQVKKVDGSTGEKMNALLDSIEWYVAMRPALPPADFEDEDGSEGEGSSGEGALAAAEDGGSNVLNVARLAAAVAALRGSDSLMVERKGKKRKGRPARATAVDMRSALLEVDVVPAAAAPAALPHGGAPVVRFRSTVDGGNPVLSPAALVRLLSGEVGQALEVAALHRSDLKLRAPAVPQPDFLKLRSLLRQDGHLAAARKFGHLRPAASGAEAAASSS